MFERLVKFLWLAVALASVTAHAAGVAISAARVWPAADYTRITLESSRPIEHKMMLLKDPERLVLDLQNVELSAALKNLSGKVLSSDPYIKQVRAANYKPGVVRLVIDLKSEIKPSLFALPPAGEYQHRLVLDVYPAADPLMAMLEGQDSPPPIADSAARTPDVAEATPSSDQGSTDKPRMASVLAPALEEKPAPPDTASVDAAAAQDKPQRNGTDRLITIAIDAGHGGEDPGAKGANGTHEKEVTLAIAKRFKALVDAEPNMRGVLTRDGDYFIPLHGRVVKARKLQADLFVSIHADSFVRNDAKGSSVFALSEHGATSVMARLLAKRENESDLIGCVSLDHIDPYLAKTLLDLSQTATINDSLKLAKAVLNHLGEINTLHKGAVEQAGFAVLKSPDTPSILVETAFISNPEEEKRLNDEDYQRKLANAILSGVKKYLSGNPPLAKGKVAM